jgi:hypothetical protein
MATDRPERDTPQVTPIENRAFFSIEEEEGYVRIEQSVGNQALYTPEEARDVADAILGAADDAEKAAPGAATADE